MYVIRNRLNEQYATGHWFVGGNKHSWGDREAARQYPCREEAHGEMVAKAYAGTCEIVELVPDSFLKRCVNGLCCFVGQMEPRVTHQILNFEDPLPVTEEFKNP